MSEKLIYNKLFTEKPVELSSEKIELSIASDLKKATDNADSLASKAFGDLQKAAENLSKLANKYEAEAKKLESSLKSDMDKYAKASKELGLDYSNNLIYTGADRSLDQMKELQSAGKKISSAVKGGAIGNI